jgi:hypothetical protein
VDPARTSHAGWLGRVVSRGFALSYFRGVAVPVLNAERKFGPAAIPARSAVFGAPWISRVPLTLARSGEESMGRSCASRGFALSYFRGVAMPVLNAEREFGPAAFPARSAFFGAPWRLNRRIALVNSCDYFRGVAMPGPTAVGIRTSGFADMGRRFWCYAEAVRTAGAGIRTTLSARAA